MLLHMPASVAYYTSCTLTCPEVLQAPVMCPALQELEGFSTYRIRSFGVPGINS